MAFKKKEQTPLDKLIDKAEVTLSAYSVDDKEYTTAVANYRVLRELNECAKKPPVDPRIVSAVITSGVSLLSFVLLLAFEIDDNVFGFRTALSKLPKPS